MPILGLPDDLPDPARRYAEALPKGRYTAFPLTSLDRTGVAVWEVALFLDNAADFPGAMPSGYGYGTTDGEALIGAIAEMAEMICPTLRLVGEPHWTGSYNELVLRVGKARITDPLTLCLPAGSPVDRDTPLAWIKAVRARTGEPVLVPMDVGALDYFELPPGYQPFTTLITNGLGAGPDIDWALGHGLLECLQRDGNGLLFRALDQGILLDLPQNLEPGTRALLDHLDGLGIEVQAKYATDEFGLANLYVVGFERDGYEPPVPIMLSACGEACDPDRERALRKALLEFCSSRVRKAYSHGPRAVAERVAPQGHIEAFLQTAGPSLENAENRALTEMLGWARLNSSKLKDTLRRSVFFTRAVKSFGELPATPCVDTRERGRVARNHLEAAGFDVLYVDCSPPNHSVAVVKVIVPGLEVETMSYYRIGERNTRKLIERDSPLIRFGEPADALRPVRLTPEALDRLGGRQPLLDTAAVDRMVGPLYPLYREPEAHHVAEVLGL
ncbi:YcaO-like family protein [Microvirga aerophila]|uniref:Methanogenesis marker 1 protein n=1 Tax=Microvirga aerophila TaxID=670291 RepID=A0A512BVR4_9HYPH|nr:YcaO-like family protein [Microvirga aerophila]GEO16030.1 methanogenesis marker 1 protein [Microvirga aerophila]